MTDSTLGRYYNLVRNIRNWTSYFSQKGASSFLPMRYTTRGHTLSFDVPTFGLYLVFKEIFLSDFYSIDKWVDGLPAQPIVVDVGANAGYFNMLLLSRRPDARIFAFEPIEHNFRLLKNNVDINPDIQAAVKVYHKAVTGTPTDHVVLYKEADSDNSVTASVYKDFEQHNLNTVTVGAISLSQILEQNKLTHIDFLKLDCEGSEYPIVYDSPREIWSKVKSVFLEVHNLDDDKRNYHAMKEFLDAAGFSSTSELASNGCYALFARNKNA